MRIGHFRWSWTIRILTLASVLGLGLPLSVRAQGFGGCAGTYGMGVVLTVPTATPQMVGVSYQMGQDGPHRGVSIVGLWHVHYTATYDMNFPLNQAAPPTPFPFLESLKTWHADGTEMENAFLPPIGGNVCFGVWKRITDRMVKLRHVGLMFNPETGAVANVFTVDEIDQVSRDGMSYHGAFTFKVYGPDDVDGTGTALAEIRGTTAATRIAVH